MTDPKAALKLLTEVKALSIRIYIDGFRTGYSSLGYLLRFPVDVVKVDRSYVNDIEMNEKDRKLVRAILALSSSLDLQIVAEGVETEGQAEIFRDLGCPLFQGYLFAKPADGQTTDDWMRRNLAIKLNQQA